MHKTEIPQYAIDGANKRRGRLHLYESIDTAKTALVVVDMQNVFVEQGAPIEVPEARDIVPNINRLAEATRAAGGTVVWVQMTQTEENFEDWSVFYSAMSEERRARNPEWMAEGSHGWEVWPKLETRPDDMYVNKDRYSAFLPGSSDIEERLRGKGIDTVIIVGTLTNVCCESSARDAMMRNFKVIAVGDANASLTDGEHNAALGAIQSVFGDVRTTDEAIALLQAGGTQAQAAE